METLWDHTRRKLGLRADPAGPVDPAQRWAFSWYLIRANLLRQWTMAWVGMGLIGAMFLFAWYQVEGGGSPAEPSFITAQVLRVLWLAILGGFLLLGRQIPPAKELTQRHFLADRGFLLINLYLAAGQAAVSQPDYTGIGLFLITVFTVASLLRYDLVWSILGLGGAGLLIFAGMWYVKKPSLAILASPLHGGAMLVLAWITMRFMYKKEVSDFFRREMIRRQGEMLERLSLMDDLTGLLNQRCLDAFLPEEWRRCAREKIALGIIVANIDHFRAFNETMGREAGDECLKIVGATLARRLGRGGDQACRYNEGDFLLILPGTNLKGAEKMAADMASAVKALRVVNPGTEAQIITLSFGAASAEPARGGASQDLVDRALGALALAKEKGRDRVVGDQG